MRRILFVLVVAVACGGKQKSTTPPPPLPEPKPEVATEEKTEPAEPPPPAPPPGPIDDMMPAAKVTVKLVKNGKGKKAPLKIVAKAGTKQQVELALDFRGKATGAMGDAEEVMHTVVLTGEAEVKTVDKDGNIDYVFTINGTDARTAAGAQMTLDQAKIVVAALKGLSMGATVHPNGSASDLKLRMEQPQPMSEGAIKLIKMSLPTLPVLPTEPVAVGAKWQVTSTVKFVERLDVTQTTDYELVGRKGNTWTIKGATKVTGADQTVEPAKMSKINGTGSFDATLIDGMLYPAMKSELQTGFTVTATVQDPKTKAPTTVEGTFDMKQTATITPKP